MNFDEVLTYAEFPNPAWHSDKPGLFYNRLPDPETVPREDRDHYRDICRHTLGTPQSKDLEISQHEDKTLGVCPQITDDGSYRVVTIYCGRASSGSISRRICALTSM